MLRYMVCTTPLFTVCALYIARLKQNLLQYLEFHLLLIPFSTGHTTYVELPAFHFPLRRKTFTYVN